MNLINPNAAQYVTFNQIINALPNADIDVNHEHIDPYSGKSTPVSFGKDGVIHTGEAELLSQINPDYYETELAKHGDKLTELGYESREDQIHYLQKISITPTWTREVRDLAEQFGVDQDYIRSALKVADGIDGEDGLVHISNVTEEWANMTDAEKADFELQFDEQRLYDSDARALSEME